MRISEKKWFPVLLQKLITISMIIGALVIIALPLIIYWFLGYYETNNYNQLRYAVYLCILYPSGVIGFIILYQARRLLVRVNESQPFVTENVKRLRFISKLTALLSLIYLVAIFFIYSFFIPVLTVVFALIALFAAVFAELFQKAVTYKEENDYTV